ncbi:MAG: asparaginyl/glutamyl-tRNA amidotransferase subunit C [Candidatus Omnitrophica bacterium CG1_02_44_16]|nr:MAG: asparaginyl/glutamyl-tRNA amidotransferase subunit C [Candidatus Omnitrophica bacterium CG1_02_44_16]PIY82107.1 MAG: Asp-tRNA(Asn)/Glu-tRNA(Gln) amidotransferase GatCAB subunit C [Candidatus Omnitrophica bacterium CG_4_10_14_0_8_um_filter_44_12]
MMRISKDDVKNIANLARLGLTDIEVESLQVQLEVILEYIDKLKKVDVSKTHALTNALYVKNVYRPDIPKASLDPSKVMPLSPAREGNFFKVPKIIE